MSQSRSRLAFGGISVPLARMALIPVGLLGSIVVGGLIGNHGVPVVYRVIALLTGGGFGVLTLVRPHWGLVVILVSLPMQSVYPNMPLVSSFVGLFGMVTLLGYVLNKYPLRLTVGARPQFLFALGFVSWIIVANPEAALLPKAGRIWAWTYIQLLMLAWMGAQLLSPSRQETLMRWYVVGSSVSAVAAVYGYLTSTSLQEAIAAGGGFAGNKNFLGSLLVPAVVMSIYLQQREERGWTKRALSFLHVLLVMGCIATVSRMALISLVVSLLSYALAGQLESRFRKGLLLEAVAIGVVSAAVLPRDYLQQAFSSLIAPLTGIGQTAIYVDPRVGFFRSAVRIWMEYPVFGVGIGRFAQAKMTFIESSFAGRTAGVAHNSFLSVLAETGTIGFLLFIAWLGALLRDLWKTAQLSRTARRSGLAAVWLGVVVNFCIIGLTHNTHYEKQLWIVSGIALALYHTPQPNQISQQMIQ